jgi:glycerol-3-phosphate dehydrogenase (NAD(P)+)
MVTVAVLGSGAWGTTLARLLADKGERVTLWEHDPARAARMERERENVTFLPGVPLPPELAIASDLARALEDAEIVLFVTPAQRTRANARLVAPLIPRDAVVITASKGIEVNTFARMTGVLAQELPPGPRDRLAVLSGPNLARLIAGRKPSATVVASNVPEVARRVQDVLSTQMMRVYTSSDVIGVELGGALKNVIAIAIGVSDGLGTGENAKATLMTRGLAEMVRLAVAEGAHPMTMMGLAGLGDLIVTCSSTLSRNYSLGFEMASTGASLAAVLATRHTVSEGVMTARATLDLAERRGIDMPITRALCLFFDGSKPEDLVASLMQRGLRQELDADLEQNFG